jgi:hypothetical protein
MDAVGFDFHRFIPFFTLYPAIYIKNSRSHLRKHAHYASRFKTAPEEIVAGSHSHILSSAVGAASCRDMRLF